MVGFGSVARCHNVLALAVVASVATLSCAPTDEVTWLGFSKSDRFVASATRQGHLHIVDLEKGARSEGENRHQITSEATDGGFAWSPTDDRLVFCIRREGAWDLAIADPAGKITLLTRDGWRDFQPTWSPDGRGIYYVSSRGGGYHGDYDIYYYDMVSSQSFPLIRGPHDQTEPHVSPDGRWLAVVSYQQGNPLILIYAVKTMRTIQIAPPPAFRGGRLRLLLWLSDSRRLVCEIEHRGRYDLIGCHVESEQMEVLDSSEQPFDSVALDRQGRDFLYTTGGKAYRRRTQPRWGRKRRLAFDGLAVTRVAVRHGDDRLGAVVAGSLLALASASGDEVRPLVDLEEEYVKWGDLELQRRHKRQGLRYYETALRLAAGASKDAANEAAAQFKLSRAPLLCRLGYAREAAAYLSEARRVLEKSMDEEARDLLYSLLGLNEYVWNNRREPARMWIEEIPPERRSSAASGNAALLLEVLDHPDGKVRRAYRRGIAALWKGEIGGGLRVFERLLESHPTDPVVQALYERALHDQFALPLEGVFESPSDPERHAEAFARMAVRYREILGDHFEMDRKWFEKLAGAQLTLRDTDGLRQLLLRYGPQFVRRDELLAFYRGYWDLEAIGGQGGPAAAEILARVLFDREVLARLSEKINDPQGRTDVRLARARRALVTGDYDEMKRALGVLAEDLDRLGADRLFGTDGERAIAYTILRGELDERLGIWEKAVAHYREAAREIERLTRDNDSDTSGYLRRLLRETRFRADLLQRGAAVRAEITDLLMIEHGVGDQLVTHSSDPTSLANGIHNLFALLGRLSTPWVKDLVYLKAGQSYRGLGRWGEAGFCLRIAAQSRARFIGRRARVELADLYGELEDPALAGWFSPRRY